MEKEWGRKWQKKYLPPNTLLKDKYRISAVLGVGNFGITYLGVDTLLEQLVAVKEFFPANVVARSQMGKEVLILEESAETFEKEKQAFKEEAVRIFGLFDIPGICAVKDYFEENNTAYIVEEYLSGGTLKEYLDDQDGHKMSWEECREIFAPVMKGLCTIHSMGIVHRDISPDNLMFSGEGELKLIDFGASRMKEAEDASVKVKETYAPPEQYQEEELVGPWTDIYALCSVMYQALTGNKPVPALQRIRKDTLSSISNYTNIPTEAESAIRQGLSLDIPKRYFYIGNLMDKLKMDTEDVQKLIEKNRSVWGELWLKIITENHTELQKTGKKLSYSQKKGILAAVLAVILVGALLVGGVELYKRCNPEKVLQYEAKKAQEELGQELDEPQLITSEADPDGLKNVLEALEPYDVTVEDAEEGYRNYEVPNSVLKELGLLSNGYMEYGKFYLDVDFLEDLLGYIYEQDIEKDYESYDGRVTFREEGSKRTLAVRAYASASYKLKNADGEDITFSVYYDPVDELISMLRLEGDIEDGRYFVENIFPYFVTETYFTEKEVKMLFAAAEEAYEKQDTLENEDEYIYDGDGYALEHARFRLTVDSTVGMDYKKTQVSLSRNGYYW